MKKAIHPMSAVLSVAVLLWVGAACTGNSLFDDDVSLGTAQLRGSVALDDGSSPAGVFVWLEKFNVSAFTGNDGKFQLTLPPPQNQGTPEGLTGTFTLYAYIANYHLVSAKVHTLNGGFVYGQDNITEKGELSTPFLMRSYLRIDTTVEPYVASLAAHDTVTVRLTMQVPFQSTVVSVKASVLKLCENFVCPPDTFGAVFAKNVVTNDVFKIQSFNAVAREPIVIDHDPLTRTMVFSPAAFGLPAGQYEIIPYLLIEQETIPQGLINGIGSTVLNFTPDYLKLPLRRNNGRLLVSS